MALQQQQQNLQQQLQNFILFQQPTNVQTSAMLLQSQISQAVAQARPLVSNNRTLSFLTIKYSLIIPLAI